MLLYYLLLLVGGYLIGSVSPAVILSTVIYRKDVRLTGSGNAGATNVARAFGMGSGLLVFVGDLVKTAVCGLAGWLLLKETGLSVACLGCLLGHCWPVYYHFRGGKGVTVSACIALMIDWRVLLVLVAVFFLTFLFSRRVSLCSLLAALAFPTSYYFWHPGMSVPFVVALLCMAIVIVLHHKNIVRLVHGEEPKFVPHHKK